MFAQKRNQQRTVKEQYRNQGIATELLIGMLQTAQTVFPGKVVTIKQIKRISHVGELRRNVEEFS